jgi:hypothetical protein
MKRTIAGLVIIFVIGVGLTAYLLSQINNYSELTTTVVNLTSSSSNLAATASTNTTFSPKIVDGSTGQNITTAAITFSGGDLTSPRSITYTNGAYTITGLSIGQTYNVAIAASGYVTANTSAGISIPNETVTWYLHPPGTTIEILSASTNQIVPGATVIIFGGNLSSPLILTTNGNGFITTSALTIGKTYNITVAAPNFNTLTTTFNVSTANESALWLLTAGTASPTTFTPSIVDSTGKTVTNATITFSGADLTSPRSITYANGAYTITGLTIGQTYTVSISAPNYATLNTTAGIWIPNETVQWSLTPTAPAPVTSTGFWITDAKTGTTIVGSSIIISGGNLTTPVIVTTKSGVTPVTSALAIGRTYNIAVVATGYATLNTTLAVSSANQAVHWNLAAAIGNITVTAGGLPVSSASILAIDDETEAVTSLTSGSNGQITFPDVFGDSYTILASNSNDTEDAMATTVPSTQDQDIPLFLDVVPTQDHPTSSPTPVSPPPPVSPPALLIFVPGMNAGDPWPDEPESYFTDLYNAFLSSSCNSNIALAYFKYNGISERTDTSASNLDLFLASQYASYDQKYGVPPPAVYFFTYSEGDNVFRRATQLVTDPLVASLIKGATVYEFHPIWGGVDQDSKWAFFFPGTPLSRFTDVYYGYSYEKNLFSQSSLNAFNSLVGKQTSFQVVGDKYTDGVWRYLNPTWFAQETAISKQVWNGQEPNPPSTALATLHNLGGWVTAFKQAASGGTYNEYCLAHDAGAVYGIKGLCNNALPASDTSIAALLYSPGHAILLFDNNFLNTNVVAPVCSSLPIHKAPQDIYPVAMSSSGTNLTSGIDPHWTFNGGPAYITTVCGNTACTFKDTGLSPVASGPIAGGTYPFSTSFFVPSDFNASTFYVDIESPDPNGVGLSYGVQVILNGTTLTLGSNGYNLAPYLSKGGNNTLTLSVYDPTYFYSPTPILQSSFGLGVPPSNTSGFVPIPN